MYPPIRSVNNDEVSMATRLAKQGLIQDLLALQSRLRRFAYGLTGSLDEADDLVQAAYERALARLDQWQPGTRLDSWMYRIVQSIRLNRLDAERVRGSHLEAVDPDLLVGSDGRRETEAQLTLEGVRRFIWCLPEEQRVVLLLVAVEGLSYKDAAEVLDLAVGTVTSRLARARLAVKEFVDGNRWPERQLELTGTET
jgi:RNA polymerase sigma-70 factor (ECF subfamily)